MARAKRKNTSFTPEQKAMAVTLLCAELDAEEAEYEAQSARKIDQAVIDKALAQIESITPVEMAQRWWLWGDYEPLLGFLRDPATDPATVWNIAWFLAKQQMTPQPAYTLATMTRERDRDDKLSLVQRARRIVETMTGTTYRSVTRAIAVAAAYLAQLENPDAGADEIDKIANKLEHELANLMTKRRYDKKRCKPAPERATGTVISPEMMDNIVAAITRTTKRQR
jgi:hypothetical protein